MNYSQDVRRCQAFYRIYCHELRKSLSSANIAIVLTLRYTINVEARPQVSRRPFFPSP